MVRRQGQRCQQNAREDVCLDVCRVVVVPKIGGCGRMLRTLTVGGETPGESMDLKRFG